MDATRGDTWTPEGQTHGRITNRQTDSCGLEIRRELDLAQVVKFTADFETA